MNPFSKLDKGNAFLLIVVGCIFLGLGTADALSRGIVGSCLFILIGAAILGYVVWKTRLQRDKKE